MSLEPHCDSPRTQLAPFCGVAGYADAAGIEVLNANALTIAMKELAGGYTKATAQKEADRASRAGDEQKIAREMQGIDAIGRRQGVRVVFIVLTDELRHRGFVN